MLLICLKFFQKVYKGAVVNKKFLGFENIDMSDLIYAYKKAKADVFFENNLKYSADFANYEWNLEGNLSKLLEKIRKKEFYFLLSDTQNFLYPKNIEFNSDVEDSAICVNPGDDFLNKLNSSPTLHVRFMTLFSVEVHIFSSLWINFIGHKLDSK